jgi:hypothetical protein
MVIGGGGCAIGVLKRGIARRGSCEGVHIAMMWRGMLRFDCRSVYVFDRVLDIRCIVVKRTGRKIVRTRRVLVKMPGVVSWGVVHLVAACIRGCWLIILEGLGIMACVLLQGDERKIVGVERIGPVGGGIAD